MTGFFCLLGSTPALLGGMWGGRVASLSFIFRRIEEGMSSEITVEPIETGPKSAKRNRKVYCSRDELLINIVIALLLLRNLLGIGQLASSTPVLINLRCTSSTCFCRKWGLPHIFNRIFFTIKNFSVKKFCGN